MLGYYDSGYRSSFVVFRREAVSSAPRAPAPLGPFQDLAPQPFLEEIHHSCLLSPHTCAIVLLSFEPRRCGQERVDDNDTIAAETLLGLVRVLPRVPPDHSLYVFVAIIYRRAFHLLFYASAPSSHIRHAYTVPTLNCWCCTLEVLSLYA